MPKKSKRRSLRDPSQLSPVADDARAVRVVIETPKGSRNKYAFDPDDRVFTLKTVLPAGMAFPYDFGFVPSTLAGDGDPVDVLVLMPLPLIPGSVIRCRPVGMLKMTDEAGADTKIVAAPAKKVFAHYDYINDIGDVAQHWRDRIGHFFEHYKDLEQGKWVKIDGWEDAAAARREILESIARYQECPEKPAF